MDKNIHKGHRDRLRDLAYKNQFKNMPPHQVLELLLTYVIPRKDTNPIAHNLIKEFGSFGGVLDASRDDLLKIMGVGEKTANFLSSIKYFFYEYNKSKVSTKASIFNTRDAVKFAQDLLEIKINEEFYVICLDNSNKVKLYEHVSTGVVNKANVDIRKVAEVAFKSNAANIIICHNHPQGKALPSHADDKLTKTILTALVVTGINLIDHIIIGENDFFSYHKEGVLENYYEDVKHLISMSAVRSPKCKYDAE